MVRPGGLFRPQHKILGSDIAGRVEAVGGAVERFRPGDEVFADLTEWGFGAFADYVSVPESALVQKPASFTFEQAAAVPSAGGVALVNLKAKRRIQPGQIVLINGAGGGMGTFAVQIAKSYGAEVTGVDSTAKLSLMRSIGADHVIDYTQQDFTRNADRYDLILDVAAHHSVFDYRRALSPHGIYLMVGGSMTTLFQTLLLGPLLSDSDGKTMGMVMVYPGREDLEDMKVLLEGGEVVPVIDRTYTLTETSEAMRYLATGQALGKVVVTM